MPGCPAIGPGTMAGYGILAVGNCPLSATLPGCLGNGSRRPAAGSGVQGAGNSLALLPGDVRTPPRKGMSRPLPLPCGVGYAPHCGARGQAYQYKSTPLSMREKVVADTSIGSSAARPEIPVTDQVAATPRGVGDVLAVGRSSCRMAPQSPGHTCAPAVDQAQSYMNAGPSPSALRDATGLTMRLSRRYWRAGPATPATSSCRWRTSPVPPGGVGRAPCPGNRETFPRRGAGPARR
jgi:hypothetical protein